MNKNNLLNQYQNDKTYGTGDHGIAAPYLDICGRLRRTTLLSAHFKGEDEGDADEEAGEDE